MLRCTLRMTVVLLGLAMPVVAAEDPLGGKILESGREPSYEAVAAVLPPLSKPREAVGTKEGRYEIGVYYDGTLQFDSGVDNWQRTGPTAWFEIGNPPVRFGSTGCAKRLLNGHLPIVIATYKHDDLVFEQTVLGWSEGMRPEAELWGYVRLSVSNPGSAERTISVALKSKPETISKLEPAALQVPANGTAELCFRIPSPARDAAAARVDNPEFASRSEEVSAYWLSLIHI